VFRVVVIRDEVPDSEAYAKHVEVCRQVPDAVFRHGPVFGSRTGAATHAHYAEFEWGDRAAFEAGIASEEFRAAGRDARDRGLPTPASVEFIELS
jgi:hypothetical protein